MYINCNITGGPIKNREYSYFANVKCANIEFLLYTIFVKISHLSKWTLDLISISLGWVIIPICFMGSSFIYCIPCIFSKKCKSFDFWKLFKAATCRLSKSHAFLWWDSLPPPTHPLTYLLPPTQWVRHFSLSLPSSDSFERSRIVKEFQLFLHILCAEEKRGRGEWWTAE